MSEYERCWIDSRYGDYVKWLFDGIDENKTTKMVIKSIPRMRPSIERLVASRVPRKLAFLRYRRKLGKPMRPVALFRNMCVHLYNVLKGATDQNCQLYADIVKSGRVIHRFTQLVAHMYMIYATIASLRIGRIVRYSQETENFGDKTLAQFRKYSGNNRPFVDDCSRLADFLAKIPGMGLGGFALGVGHRTAEIQRVLVSTPLPMVEKWRPPNEQTIVAVKATTALSLLYQRAVRLNREITQSDFLKKVLIYSTC